MNVLDLFILVFLIIGGYYGYKQGLIMAVFQLIAVVLGLYVALHFSNQIALLFVSSNDGIVVPLLAFVLVLIGVYFLVKLLGGVFERSVKFAWPSILNNLFGALIGSLKWCFLAGSLFLIIMPIDSSGILISHKSKQESVLFGFTTGFTETVMPGVKNTLVLGYGALVKE